MDEQDPVLIKMKALLAEWESNQDRRLIFLTCYEMMTQNILQAIEDKDFEDVEWVATLMNNFANYYFRALDSYETEQARPPTPWQIAFQATQHPRTHALQDLVLGVNAHINYDLVYALSDILAPEWSQLTDEKRKMRYRDHCHVNEIINHTINAVQDQVIDRYQPFFGLVDKVLGPIDEWMTALLISEWREEVWEHATKILDSSEPAARQAILARVEQISIQRAHDILGLGGLVELVDFL
jgi:hypothetical protein